jgi:hypothetical protein
VTASAKPWVAFVPTDPAVFPPDAISPDAVEAQHSVRTTAFALSELDAVGAKLDMPRPMPSAVVGTPGNPTLTLD